MSSMVIRFLILILLLSSGITAKTEIWLSGTNFEQNTIPDRVLISVFSDRSGLYKIDGFGGAVASGKMRAGHTIIPLAMALKAGIKRYELKIRFGDGVEKIWRLTLRVVDGAREKDVPVQKQLCFVRLYSRGELVADSAKYRIRKLTTKTAGEPEEMNYGKYDPVTGDYPGLRRLALPVLALPLMIVRRVVENKIRKKREKKKRRMRVVSGSFINRRGQKVNLAVMLGVEDQK